MNVQHTYMEELRHQLQQMQLQAVAPTEREAAHEAERLELKARLKAIPRNAAEYMQP